MIGDSWYILDATENTIMEVEKQPSVSEENIEKLVDAKIQEATKKLQQQHTKNKAQGAYINSALLKKKFPSKTAPCKHPSHQQQKKNSKPKGSKGSKSKGFKNRNKGKNTSTNKAKGSNGNLKQKSNQMNKKSSPLSRKHMA